MDFNKLFTNPGYILVAEKIVGFLSYESIQACRDVSPIWKKFIDQQKFWRLDRFFSLIKEDWMVQKAEKMYSRDGPETFAEKVDLLEEFPEWKKLIPHVENQMSVSDLDILINGLERYIAMSQDMFPKDPKEYEKKHGDYGNQKLNQFCPLSFAVKKGDFEFVEMMIRTPFDFNSLKFKFPTCRGGSTPEKRHGNCDTYDDLKPWRWDDFTHYEGGYNVLDKAIKCGHTSIVELILKFADEKKIKKGSSAFCQASNSPDIAKLLLKHCKYDRKSLSQLGTKTLADLVMQQANNEEVEVATSCEEEEEEEEEDEDESEDEDEDESEDEEEEDEDEEVEEPPKKKMKAGIRGKGIQK